MTVKAFLIFQSFETWFQTRFIIALWGFQYHCQCFAYFSFIFTRNFGGGASHLRVSSRKSFKVVFLFQNSRVDGSKVYHFSSFLILYRFRQSVFENFHLCGFSKNTGIEPKDRDRARPMSHRRWPYGVISLVPRTPRRKRNRWKIYTKLSLKVKYICIGSKSCSFLNKSGFKYFQF